MSDLFSLQGRELERGFNSNTSIGKKNQNNSNETNLFTHSPIHLFTSKKAAFTLAEGATHVAHCKDSRKVAFTLAEVLITLGIIGVVAALTLPSFIANYKEKELVVKAKKSYSDIQNAILLAQQENGNIGDNSALFNFSDGYSKVTENFSKYFKDAKFCKNQVKCKNFYYDILYAAPNYDSSGNLKVYYTNKPKIILTSGAVLHINELIQNCDSVRTEITYDKDGNPTSKDNHTQYCAIVHFDVNGPKAPNQFGKDVFSAVVYKDKVVPDKWAQIGGKALINILSGKE